MDHCRIRGKPSSPCLACDTATEDIFHGTNSKAARKIPKGLWPIVRRKLDLVNAAAGVFSIRVNDQYRITFRFAGEYAHDVCCADYH